MYLEMAASPSYAARMPAQVHCDVCNVYVSSAGLLQTHTKGKKHQQMLQFQEEQDKASKVSVYATGFKCNDTSEDEMNCFFSEYGPVKKIYFDKNKGRFAIVEFEHENSVIAILEQTDPVIFKGKTLKIKKRTFTSHNSESERKEMKDVTVAKKRKKKHSETLSCVMSSEIIAKMNQASSVSEQMKILMNQLKLSSEEFHLRSLICDILKEVFQEFVPTCDVVLFGSSANGLGCKGSDLDVSLLVDPNMEHWNIDLKDISDSKSNMNTDKKIHSASKDVHCFVLKVLRNLVPGCVNIIPIFTAKCPVIKFIHQPTSISCDLTVNNKLGLQNTALLKCYLELDPRVSQLVYTVRTWAKVIGICGGGSGQLTNYALTVMVLNFLQTTDPPVLPSLQDISGWPMKDIKIRIDKELVDGWDCGFYKDIDNLLPSTNTKPVETLLEEFFDFYGRTFDYGNCAVIIKKHGHFLISSLEEELQEVLSSKFIDEHENAEAKREESVKTRESVTTWKKTPLCVQDPFELTHNLTQNVGVSALRDIIQCMIDARNICQRFSSDGQLDMSSADRGIVQLFKYTPRTASKKQRKDGYSFTVSLSDKEDSDTTSAAVLSSFASVESFFQRICHYMENDLKINCVTNSEKQAKDSLSVVCTANRNTWTHSRRERRKGLQHEEPSTSCIDKETYSHEEDCSAIQLKSSNEGEDVDFPCLVFRLTVSRDSMLKGLECNVKLEHLGGEGLQTFENFYAYFKKKVAVVFK